MTRKECVTKETHGLCFSLLPVKSNTWAHCPMKTKIVSSFRKWVAIIKTEKTALIASLLVCSLHSLEARFLLRGIFNALWSSSGITNSFGGTTESQSQKET